MEQVKKRNFLANSVLCCRACLATDVKLINMLDNKLDGEFFRVSGIPLVKSRKILSPYLCVCCAAIVKRNITFRAKCLRANNCLKQYQCINILTIKSIDRQAHNLVSLSFTDIETISVDSKDCSNMSVSEPTPVDLNVANVKLEENPIDIQELQDDTNKLDLKNDLFFEIDSLNCDELKVDVVEQSFIMKIETENDDMLEVDCLDENIECNKELERDETIECNKEIERYENIEYNEELESEVIIEPTNEVEKKENISKMTKRKAKNVNTEVKNKRRKINNKRNGVDINHDKNVVDINSDKNAVKGKKRKGLKKGQRSEDGFMSKENLEKVKVACDVDIVILTLEEQLAEIEERKASKEYKNAAYQCELCGRHFRAEETYKNHCEKHSETRGPIECQVCKIRLKPQTHRWLHYDLHRLKYVCRQCGFVSRNRSTAKQHHDANHGGKKYQCRYCPQVFSKFGSRLTHLRLRHKTMNAVCGMCGETFIDVHKHMVHTHGVAVKKTDMECKICDVTFVNTHALNKHKMAAGEEHTSRKMHPCVQCGDNFDSVDAMKTHDDKEHPKCEDCNITFLNAASFSTHVDRKHLNIGHQHLKKQKEANQRARELGQRVPYPTPPRKRGKNRSANAVCHHCGKIFANSSLLKYHLRKLRGEKLKYACPHCPKSFYIRIVYEAHLRSHTGEKPFQCDHCGMAFTAKCNLQRHVLRAHMGIYKKTACDICGAVFTTPSSIRMHVRAVHNGEPWPKRVREKKTKVATESID